MRLLIQKFGGSLIQSFAPLPIGQITHSRGASSLRSPPIVDLLCCRSSPSTEKSRIHQSGGENKMNGVADTPSPTSLQAVAGGEATNPVKVTRALISVFDKTGIVSVAKGLEAFGVEILSTGGSFKMLKEAGVAVAEVADYTGAPEILDGRVKTLHPKVHGGLLYVRGNAKHEEEVKKNGIKGIDLVICNLYPFAETVKKHGDNPAVCIENIDIGGPCMLRSAAKNYNYVSVLTSPSQYASFLDHLSRNSGSVDFSLRQNLSFQAFRMTAAYDAAISTYMDELTREIESDAKNFNGESLSLASSASTLPPAIPIVFTPQRPLKYGVNPHQSPAALCSVNGRKLPFEVINGTPGYINFLDAILAWQLVDEISKSTGVCAAASFKHCSPAGAALDLPLSPFERKVFDVPEALSISRPASAYIRARNADPKCSFGDFAAFSGEVDLDLAMVMKSEVSDGIVARGYTPEALEILKKKKNGNFIILESDASYTPPSFECREIFGVGFYQKRNDKRLESKFTENPVTKIKEAPVKKCTDLLLASICLKYTQSNSVGCALDGQMIGVAAGQQSRVDCVKLAATKAAHWYLRQHPKVMGLKFKEGVKRQERVNARVRYIEGDFTDEEIIDFHNLFDEIPKALSEEEKREFLKSLDGVSLSSDAFFPFRDNIDHAAKLGVKFIAQPGGSVQDPAVTAACDAYGIFMVHTDTRLFLH